MTEPLPLEGVKVADFSWVIAGPMTTKYLAMYGATVVKVESNARLDSARIGTPFMGKPSRNSSGMFANMNPSKMSIALNLSMPRARDVARRLVAWADIATENFSVGQMKDWGLDYESLRDVNPRLIMLSSSQQGQTGPHAAQPGLGNLLQGLAGITHLTGYPDREPRAAQIPTPDLLAPWFSLISIIAALEHRDRTGRGQYLDLSQLESTLQFMGPQMLDYLANGREQQRRGNFSEEEAPHNAYRCLDPIVHSQSAAATSPLPLSVDGEGVDRRRRDGGEVPDHWCVIAVRTDEQWRGFRRVIGDPPWTAEPRFSTLVSRLHNVDDLDRLVGQWTLQHPAEEVMRLMQGAGVPAGIVQDARALHSDPQLAHRKHFNVVEHPGRGVFPYDMPSFRISDMPPVIRRAPDLGQDTERVCREFIGMSQEEFNALQAEGVLA